jgi:uncharacterized membrane protein YkvA (DUF1232 family)
MSMLKEAALALPRLALLIPKVIADDRTPVRLKLALAGLGVYLISPWDFIPDFLISPWDFIPDFIPIFGQLDDLAAILLLVDGTLNQVDDVILLDNWTGDVKTLQRLQFLAGLVSSWVPARVKTVLFGRAVREGRRRMEGVEAD